MRISFNQAIQWLPIRRETVLQTAVIVGTLLIAVVIGLKPQDRFASADCRWLIALVVMLLWVFFALLRYLPWGLVALVPVSFLIDIQIRTGTNVALNATFLSVMLLIAVWLVRVIAVERQIRLRPGPAYSGMYAEPLHAGNPVSLPALLFLGACCLGWLSSFLPWLPLVTSKPSLPAQLGSFLLYVLSIGGFLMTASALNSLRLIKIFTWTYLAFASFYLLVVVVSRDNNFVYRWLVDSQYGQSLFWTLLAALATGQGLLNRDLIWPLRAGLLMLSGITLAYALFFRSSWISGWLPPLIALAILIWLWNWRIGLGLSLVGLAFTPLISHFLAVRVNDPVQQWSSFTRFATWPIIIKLILLNPINGLGPAAYPFYTPFYRYLGYFLEFNTHNNYFDIVLQSGLFGLAMFGWLVVAIFRQGWRAWSRASDGFSRGFAGGMLAGLAAALISGAFADWFMPFLYNIGIPGFQGSIYLWLFAGGLVSLSTLTAEPAK